MFRKGFVFLFILLASQSYSQVGVSLKLGASPWHFTDHFDDLSNPISLAYSGGIDVEKVLGNSFVGVMTGIHYSYSPPGTHYTDLTDQQNPVAMLYEEVVNKRYIEVVHHELTVPFMFVFYHNGLRTGLGASYSRYRFNNALSLNGPETLYDYGLRACTGTRLSKRMIFTIGYYYGLKDMILLNTIPESPPYKANMQQLNVCLAISLFNSFNDQKYFVTSE